MSEALLMLAGNYYGAFAVLAQASYDETFPNREKVVEVLQSKLEGLEKEIMIAGGRIEEGVNNADQPVPMIYDPKGELISHKYGGPVREELLNALLGPRGLKIDMNMGSPKR